MSTHALSTEEARRAFDEIVAAVRGLPSPALMAVGGFLVAPDVWDELCVRIPIGRGGSLSVGERLFVRRVRELPTGAIVPVDSKGKPLPKPSTDRRGAMTTIALSLRQPWAWLVVHGGKDLENRAWNTKRRGPFLVHAAKGMTLLEYSEAVLFARDADPSIIVPPPVELERGGIVGVANVVDVVPPCLPKGYVGPFACRCGERWHIGDQFGFRLADVKPLPFRPVAGRLGFFEVPRALESVTMNDDGGTTP